MIPFEDSAGQAPRDGVAKQIISRRDALAAGEKYYFTGKPCSKGHVAERYTCSTSFGKCVICARLHSKRQMKTYRRPYYEKTRDKQLRYSQQHYAKNKAGKRATETAWRKGNPEKSRSYGAKWRAANPEQSRRSSREWARNNKDKRHAHRAMRQKAQGSFTRADISEIMKSQKGRCAVTTCKVKLGPGFHVDHIKPLKLGGTNWRSNIQLLCALCNAKKGARDPIDYARSLGLLL